MKRTLIPVFLAAVLGVTAARPAEAVVIGLTDTFEGTTTEGWLINLLGMGGGVAQPVVVPAGGPAGALDGWLRLTATGAADAGGRLVALNVDQWTGNYLAAGVTAIRMDVNNLGATDLSLRLLFEQVGPMGPTDVAASTLPVVLPAGSGWRSVLFPIGVANLTALDGSVAAALANVNAIRIFSNPAVGFPPPAFAAQLGLDNIRAVPEPVTLLMLGTGLAGVLARRRRTATGAP